LPPQLTPFAIGDVGDLPQLSGSCSRFCIPLTFATPFEKMLLTKMPYSLNILKVWMAIISCGG
jgi:hypothetical protein